MKKIIVIILSLTLLSCFNNKKEEKKDSGKKDSEKNTTNLSRIGRQNYAVVWKWTTDDVKLVKDYNVAQTNEFQEMVEYGVVQNLYYNRDLEVDKLENSSNISFFIKAKDEQEVKKILNKMVFVKNNIAAYTIYPVGTKWLAKNPKKILGKEVSKSFISIWTTLDKNPNDKVLKAQSEGVLKLWDEGLIENVFFFIDGNQGETSKTNFMFFVNSNSEMDAETVLDKLPFVENNIASYKLIPVGNFWKGAIDR